jgi:hypothetical protein
MLETCLGFLSFDIRICFALRYSDFGFEIPVFRATRHHVSYASYYWDTALDIELEMNHISVLDDVFSSL